MSRRRKTLRRLRRALQRAEQALRRANDERELAGPLAHDDEASAVSNALDDVRRAEHYLVCYREKIGELTRGDFGTWRPSVLRGVLKRLAFQAKAGAFELGRLGPSLEGLGQEVEHA